MRISGAFRGEKVTAVSSFSLRKTRRWSWGLMSGLRAHPWWWSLLWFPKSPGFPSRVQCHPDAAALHASSRHGPQEPSYLMPTWPPCAPVVGFE